jgi:Uma2 family endonuclease
MSAIAEPVTPTSPPAKALASPPISHASTKCHPTVIINGDVMIPDWVVDHASYRRWAHSDEFPERGRYSYINGTIWVDLAMEQFFSHNQVKTEYCSVLRYIVKTAQSGYFGGDGNLWTHVEAGVSTEPDGMYFTFDTLQSGRIRLIDGKEEGYVELEGSPNMTLEVISASSITKDTIILKDQCAKAGVDEYWLVDARGAELRFEIWGLHEGQYVAAPTVDGWLESAVFNRSFKLEQSTDPLGHPSFQLLVR